VEASNFDDIRLQKVQMNTSRGDPVSASVRVLDVVTPANTAEEQALLTYSVHVSGQSDCCLSAPADRTETVSEAQALTAASKLDFNAHASVA